MSSSINATGRAGSRSGLYTAAKLGGALLAYLVAMDAAAAQEAAAATAEQAPADAAAEAEAGDDFDNAIVVTARRRQERLQDVPVAVTAVTGEAIGKLAIANLEGISQLVPGLVVGRQITGTSASIFMRGVGSTALSASFEQSVSLNLDGISMSRGRELLNAQFDLDRVEVLKGPQALFFGRNATGGLISITSRNPTDRFEASAKAGYEFDANEKYGEGVISGPIAGDLLGRIAVRASGMDGYIKNTAQTNTLAGYLREPVEDVPHMRTAAVRGTLLYAPAGSPFEANLKLLYTSLKDAGAGPYERVCGFGRTTPRPTFGIADPFLDCKANGVLTYANIPANIARGLRWGRDGDPYTDYTSGSAVLNAKYAGESATLSSITAFYKFKQTDLDPVSSSTATQITTQLSKFDQFSQEFQLATDLDGPVNATGGVIYAHGKMVANADPLVTSPVLTDPLTGNTATFRRDGGFKQDSYSAFAELSWDVVEDVELAGGARWTKEKRDSNIRNIYVQPALAAAFPLRSFEDTFKDTKWSPQATLTWRPTTANTLYGAYKTGFKSGGFNNNLVISPTTRLVDGQFDSETTKGFEVGSKNSWGEFMLNVTGYSYKYSGLQVQVYDAVTFGQRVNNVGDLRTKGIEVQTGVRNAGIEGLNLNADIAYNDAKYQNYSNASCYTGQTVAAGCNGTPNAAGVFNTQNLSGVQAIKAPKWTGRVNATYSSDISDSLAIDLLTALNFSSKYNYIETVRPDAVQKGYTMLDASIRLGAPDERWGVSLIGRNLTDKHIITTANELGSQGAFGTGTATGLSPDLGTIVSRGRQIMIEVSTKF